MSIIRTNFFRRTGIFTAAIFGLGVLAADASAQQPEATPVDPTTVAAPRAQGDGNVTAEQVVESAIFVYGGGGGRAKLDQIRKTTLERGRLETTNATGQVEKATFQRWVIRGDNSDKDRVRYELDLPSARYSMVFKDEKIYGIYNDRTFIPRDDASKSFENLTFRHLDALLRYKENESTIALADREKIMGVDYYVVDVTDKKGRKTRFYVSEKSFQVKILEFEEGGDKYKRKFYDYRYAQGTLVPFRTVLWVNDKKVEEVNVGTYTFGQRVEEGLFPDIS